VVLEHAKTLLEALYDQVGARENDSEDKRLANACCKLIGWISERRILTSLTLSPPWLLPLLGTMCHSLATSHGGPSWTKDIPPELGGQTLLFAATTCSLQGHHKEVLQLMKQYLSKYNKVGNLISHFPHGVPAMEACVIKQCMCCELHTTWGQPITNSDGLIAQGSMLWVLCFIFSVTVLITCCSDGLTAHACNQ